MYNSKIKRIEEIGEALLERNDKQSVIAIAWQTFQSQKKNKDAWV